MNNRGKVKLILANLEEIVACGFIVATTLLVIVNVFLRYVMKTGLFWSEEVATSCFVWSVFIGSAACFKRKGHVGVDILVDHLPLFLQNLVKLAVDLILVILMAYITYNSYIYVSLSYIKPTPVLGISSAYVSVSILISFLLWKYIPLFFSYRI